MLIPFGVFSAAGSSVSNSYELIATASLTSNGAVNFTSIPQNYKHLQLRGAIIPAGSSTGLYNDSWAFNADYTGSNYNCHQMYGNGSSVVSVYGSGGFNLFNAYYASGTNIATGVVVDILDYTSTSKYKTVRGMAGSAVSSYDRIYLSSGLWRSTAAISEIIWNFGGTQMRTGTRISLYGIKG